MSVDLWTMENVAIHFRQGYGGQDMKMLPVAVLNTNEAWRDFKYFRLKIFDLPSTDIRKKL